MTTSCRVYQIIGHLDDYDNSHRQANTWDIWDAIIRRLPEFSEEKTRELQDPEIPDCNQFTLEDGTYIFYDWKYDCWSTK